MTFITATAASVTSAVMPILRVDDRDGREGGVRSFQPQRSQSTTLPAVRLTSVAVIVRAQSEDRNAAALPTSARVGRRPSIVDAASESKLWPPGRVRPVASDGVASGDPGDNSQA